MNTIHSFESSSIHRPVDFDRSVAFIQPYSDHGAMSNHLGFGTAVMPRSEPIAPSGAAPHRGRRQCRGVAPSFGLQPPSPRGNWPTTFSRLDLMRNLSDLMTEHSTRSIFKYIFLFSGAGAWKTLFVGGGVALDQLWCGAACTTCRFGSLQKCPRREKPETLKSPSRETLTLRSHC